MKKSLDVVFAVRTFLAGDKVKLEYYRQKETRSVEVTLGEIPGKTVAKGAAPSREEPGRTSSRLGATVSGVTEELQRQYRLPGREGVVVLGGLCLARHKVRPFGTPGSMGTVMNQALVRWLALLPLLWFTAFTWQLVLRAMGHAPSLQEALRLFIEGRDIWQRASLLVFAVILAPVAEEMLFRGILLPLLVRRTGAMAGLLLTAVGFAALHGNLGTFVPLAVISVALSLAYARTGSLLVPMAMHALFNGANLALLWVLLRAGVA